MRFLVAFFVTVLVLVGGYVGAGLALLGAPIPAEYWVREMITIKRQLADEIVAPQGRILLSGGSSTLFGVDADAASRRLDRPVFNYGLHAGLGLPSILKAVGGAAKRGDDVVLMLEPAYFRCHPKFTEWQVANLVGWDHDTVAAMGPLDRLELVSAIPPGMLVQMAQAKAQARFSPDRVAVRLAALDDARVLEKFRKRSAPTRFEYSAYHLNDRGDLQRIEGTRFTGRGVSVGAPNTVCEETFRQLAAFRDEMKAKGARLFFANTPYIGTPATVDMGLLRKGEETFRRQMAPLGCVIDRRQDLVFPLDHFFNTALHLNAQGRARRTELLVEALATQVLRGPCGITAAVPAAVPPPAS
jgi:hypothetical protein